jgi:hypothetical protein
VTLIVVGGTLAAFNDGIRANEHVAHMADTNDNLRAGMNLMVRDFIQVGQGIPVGGIPVPPGILRPSPPGQSYTFPPGNTTLPAANPGPGLGPLLAGQSQATDMVTILYADNTLPLNQRPINDPTPPVGTTPCNGTIDPAGTSITFDPNSACTPNISAGSTALHPGDLIMFSNVQGNALKMITSIALPKVSFDLGDAFNLNQVAGSGTLQQLQAPAGSGSYPPTTATRVWMITYYLDQTTDPLHTRLVRQVNFSPPAPVGEFFENLQITYNFVDGVTNPSNQKGIPACTPPNCLSENQIRAVNLFLSARSSTPSSQTGQYFRNSLATQISLRSLAYVDRYK